MRRRIPRAVRRLREDFRDGHRVALLRDGGMAFPAMLDAIEGAERQILFEMYWFGSDMIGHRFADALASAAGRGVEVALLYDAVGSWDTDASTFRHMAEAGVKVVEFSPLAPWKKRFRIDRLTVRDHRKILVVDGRVGFTGGVNVGDLWLPLAEGGAGWRDDSVKIEGPCVSDLVACIRSGWNRQGGPALGPTPRPGWDPPPGDQRVRVLAQNSTVHQREITRAYLGRIYRAEERVWISNSYFLPDGAVVRALRLAAGRGVDVCVLMPGESDVPIAQTASRALWSRLMKSGVRIFERNGSMFHTKSAVVDGVWSTSGTFNLDYRSANTNLEVNVSVLDRGFAETMEESFRADLLQASPVDRDEFARRGWGERMRERVAYRLRKWL